MLIKESQGGKTSIVWEIFTEVEIKGVKKHQYNWCKRTFTISKSSCTSTIDRHLKTCLSYIGANKKKKKEKKKEKSKRFCLLKLRRLMVGSVTNFTYDEKKAREVCSHMILYHEYPFNIMEHQFF
jgi:hypothetical protein